MLYFKSCPKCVTGTVEHNNDSHGAYAQCLNCGFMRDLPDGLSSSELKRHLAAWRADRVAVEPESVEAVA